MQTNPEQILRAQITDLQAKVAYLYQRFGEPSPYPEQQVRSGNDVANVSAAVLGLARGGNTGAAINQLRAEDSSLDLRMAKKIIDNLPPA